MKNVIVITGSSSGFGALMARALARAGHTVYASMRETEGRNAQQVREVEQYAREHGVDLRAIELDVSSEVSCNTAIGRIVAEHNCLDVVIHNAGHMVFGPAETFSPEQLDALYDTNVLSTQRVNRAALPQLRKQRQGLVIWISSSSAAGGAPPYLAPYFAAKAAMDTLAVVYARELTGWGIETTIVVPGAFTQRHQSLRPRRQTGRSSSLGRIRERTLRRLCGAHSPRLCGHGAARRRGLCGRRRDRRSRRRSHRQAALSRAHRSVARRRGGRQRSIRPRTCRNDQTHGPRGVADRESTLRRMNA